MYIKRMFACPHCMTCIEASEYICSCMCDPPGNACDPLPHLLALAVHWPNREPRASVHQPNNLNIFRASNPRRTNRWAEHESGAFISQLSLCTNSEGELTAWGDTDWGQVSFKALKKLKGFGARTAGAWRTSQPYLMGFLVCVATTRKALWLRFLFKCLFEVSRQKGHALLVAAGSSEQWWMASGYC